MFEAYSYRSDPEVPDFDDKAPIAVMDAECALCCWGAQVIHRLDASGTMRICPIQSPLGTSLVQHYGLRPDDPETWLFLINGRPHKGFEAILHASRVIGGWTRLAEVFRVFPKSMRAWIYRRIANNRYALFGRGDMCAVPSPGFQKRLLK